MMLAMEDDLMNAPKEELKEMTPSPMNSVYEKELK